MCIQSTCLLNKSISLWFLLALLVGLIEPIVGKRSTSVAPIKGPVFISVSLVLYPSSILRHKGKVSSLSLTLMFANILSDPLPLGFFPFPVIDSVIWLFVLKPFEKNLILSGNLSEMVVPLLRIQTPLLFFHRSLEVLHGLEGVRFHFLLSRDHCHFFKQYSVLAFYLRIPVYC